MPKRRLILGILALGILAALIFALTRSREPRYHGRPLSYWVQSASLLNLQGKPIEPEAPQAIRQIGTKAIPFLIGWLHYEDHPPRFNFVDRLAAQADARLGWKKARWDRMVTARRAFYYLGTQGKPAIPELVRMINEPTGTETAIAAADALAYVGTEETLPPLMALLTNQNNPAHAASAFLVSRFGTNAVPAIPALLACLQEPNEQASRNAAVALGILHAKPDLVVPALATNLNHPDTLTRKQAARALGRFGPEARPAVTELVLTLQDNEQTVREAATNALLLIAPEALTNAPSK